MQQRYETGRVGPAARTIVNAAGQQLHDDIILLMRGVRKVIALLFEGLKLSSHALLLLFHRLHNFFRGPQNAEGVVDMQVRSFDCRKCDERFQFRS